MTLHDSIVCLVLYDFQVFLISYLLRNL
uniref:Uncharacterized protein n=1 Tax=Rhizophora mucronata TaxID=61149 RepID=A0A2P2IQD7_RHIMU